MGLDMYLYQKLDDGERFRHRTLKSKNDPIPDGPFALADVQRISDREVQVAYWRKANAVHGWFVKNCQGGIDECQETPVSWDSLMRLRDLCARVLKTKEYDLLPPVAGFLFGSTVVDDWYQECLEDTVKMLSDLDAKGTYVYKASW